MCFEFGSSVLCERVLNQALRNLIVEKKSNANVESDNGQVLWSG